MTPRGPILGGKYGPTARERAERFSVAELLQVLDRLHAAPLPESDRELLQILVLAQPGVEDAARQREAVRDYRALRAEGLPTRTAAERAGQRHGVHPQTLRQRWAHGSGDPLPLLPAACERAPERRTQPED